MFAPFVLALREAGVPASLTEYLALLGAMRAGVVEYENDVPCIPQDLTDYLSDCVVKAPNTGGTIPTKLTDPGPAPAGRAPQHR